MSKNNYVSVLPAIYRDGGYYDDEVPRSSLVHSKKIEFVGILFDGADIERRLPHWMEGPSYSHLESFRQRCDRLNAEVKKVPPSVLVKIRHAQIRKNLIFCDGPAGPAPLYEMTRKCDRPSLPKDAFVPTTNAGGVKKIEGPCFFSGSAGSSNYGHWLVDDLSRLKASEFFDFSGGSLGTKCVMTSFSDGINKVRAEASALFGFDQSVFLKQDEIYECEELYYATPISIHPLLLNPFAVKYLVLAVSAMSKSTPFKRKLFVNRIAQNSRHLKNSSEVVDLLKLHGYEEIFPEKLDFLGQASLFKSASHVVGIMGAAMANTVFCEPDAKLLYLAPDGWAEPFYWNLAATGGQQYSVIYGRTDADNVLRKHEPYRNAFVIDIVSVKKWIAENDKSL